MSYNSLKRKFILKNETCPHLCKQISLILAAYTENKPSADSAQR